MHIYEDVKEMLCDELERISKKGELTTSILDTIDKLTHSIKSIETIMAMNEYGDEYSHGGYYGRRSYAGRRGNVRRDTMGRYSRDEARDDMISELRELMNETHDDMTKSEFRKFITKLESM